MSFEALERCVDFAGCRLCHHAEQARAELAAARELLETAKVEDTCHNCVCRLNPLVGRPVPCEICVFRAAIAACERKP